MNQKNFFSKYFIEIMVILFVGIVIIIIINKNRTHVTYPQKPLSSLEAEKEKSESEESEREKPISPRPKRSLEIPQPKIKTKASRFEQMKTYLFQETAHHAILPSDLSSEEQEKIAKLKKSRKLSLDLLKERKTWVDEQQKNCDEYQSQLNLISPKINSFKQQKLPLEEQLAKKNAEIDRLKNESQQYKYIHNQSPSVRTERETNRNRLQAEIEKLQEETLEIIVKIKDINIRIGKLEAGQKYYQEMLTDAENSKKRLEKRYEIDKKESTNSILSDLNSFYKITSAEG
ncbi:hypothetical protein H7686_0001090 [Candidatus Phytoplasma asiaticum]|uniref:Uncharacterized protein n=2 Tax=Candidatus Phytoplasma asiaticum TaxID=2763338 RepID=A0AAX3B9N5_9MOLU|nr:hypothetical protein H7686_0001090 ['Parthenium hysterophorus' phyllody phytoplasma]